MTKPFADSYSNQVLITSMPFSWVTKHSLLPCNVGLMPMLVESKSGNFVSLDKGALFATIHFESGYTKEKM